MSGYAWRNFSVIVIVITITALISRGCDVGEDVDMGTEFRMSFVQIKAALNGRNQRRMKNEYDITIPKGIKKVGMTEILIGVKGKDPFQMLCDDSDAYDDFRDRIEDYDEFKKAVIDKLQPKDEICDEDMNSSDCEELRVENSSIFLSLCAIGYYQMLLYHHGKRIDGWDDAEWGEERMKMIWEFVKSYDMQKDVSYDFLKGLRKQHKKDPKNMASAYYSGSGIGHVLSLSWFKSFLGSAFGFGSKQKYAGIVSRCYRKKTKKDKVVTDDDLWAFHKCIGLKESGRARTCNAD